MDSIRWRPPMKTDWRRLPPPGRIICISVNRRDCILFNLDGLFYRAIWLARQRCSFSRGRMWTPSASRNWRRRINRPTQECYANDLTTIAKKVVKGFYKNHFLRFDRQIVLVDCLQPLNSGPQAFNDMRLALTQLMQSFHYGQRTLFRRLFSPVIDKLLFAATKADHVTLDQHANMVALLQQLIQDAWQNAAFEGISMDCLGLASVQATTSGVIEVNGEKIPALRGNRLSDGAPLTVYPGEVPSRLPGQAFWDSQGFQFEAFRPQVMDVDKPLPHIRLDAALEFLIGDKLR